MRNESRSLSPFVALCLLAACGKQSTPTPKQDPAPPVTASAAVSVAASATPSASAAAPAPSIPTLVLEKFAPKRSLPSGLYAIEGALMVAEGRRVGRIVSTSKGESEDIEWVGAIPEGMEALGGSVLDSVVGRWPDSVAALYTSANARAPFATWHPLKGKAEPHTVGEVGSIRGVARVGETTLLLQGGAGRVSEIVVVRGPKLVRKMTTDKQAGCKPGEVWRFDPDTEGPAVPPRALEATAEGTLITLGRFCEKRAPAAEVWDKSGKARILDLGRWWQKISYWPKLLKGAGDEMWAFTNAWSPVLRYRDGAFDVVPPLGRPIRQIFTSPEGKLHAFDGHTIHRHADGKWLPVARLAEPKPLDNMAIDEKGGFWATDGGVVRLRASAAPAPAPTEEACQSWFVHLYEVSDKSEPNYTFPTTRKALSTFAEVADIELVDIGFDGRHLGVVVKSRAQGEAVIAHVKATMPDEDPKLFCYAPTKPRKIDMNAKGK